MLAAWVPPSKDEEDHDGHFHEIDIPNSDTFFCDPMIQYSDDIEQTKKFNPMLGNPDKDVWTYVELDDLQADDYHAMIGKFVNRGYPHGYTEIRSSAVLQTIECIYYKNENSGEYFFQRLTPKNKIKISDRLELVDNKFVSVSVINSISYEQNLRKDENNENQKICAKTHAVYNKKNNRLYFQSYFKVKRIFAGLDFFYAEASDFEIEIFSKDAVIDMKFDQTAINSRSRKIILSLKEDKDFSLLDNNLKLDIAKIKKYNNYGTKFGAKSHWDEKSKMFVIENSEELTELLYILSERYYHAPVSGENREAEVFTRKP